VGTEGFSREHAVENRIAAKDNVPLRIRRIDVRISLRRAGSKDNGYFKQRRKIPNESV